MIKILIFTLINLISSATVFPESLLREACESNNLNMTKRTSSLIKLALQSPEYRPCNGSEHLIIQKFAKYEPFTQSAFVNRLKCDGKLFSNRAADRKLRDFVNRFDKLYNEVDEHDGGLWRIKNKKLMVVMDECYGKVLYKPIKIEKDARFGGELRTWYTFRNLFRDLMEELDVRYQFRSD